MRLPRYQLKDVLSSAERSTQPTSAPVLHPIRTLDQIAADIAAGKARIASIVDVIEAHSTKLADEQQHIAVLQADLKSRLDPLLS